MWLWLPLLFGSSSADVCYNDIYLHRINALLPSSGPFCLSHFQDSAFEYPTLNADQIVKLSAKRLRKKGNTVLHKMNGEAFQLPASLIGDLCTSYQFVEVGKNLTSECQLPIDESTCTAYSARNIFSELATVNGNSSVPLPVELANQTELLTSSWQNGSCHDLFKEAELRLFMNHSQLQSALLRLQYSPPVSSTINQKFVVSFVETLEGLIAPLPDDRVHGVQGGQRRVLEFPSLGPCDGVSRTQVVFKKALSTGCILRVNGCEDAETKLRSLRENHLPTHFMANSTAEPQEMTRIAGTQPRQSTCVLPIVFHLDFYYAKIGLTTEYREEPVALFITEQLVGLEMSEGMNLPITFKIRFTDATLAPTSFFSDLPYIDLRLPADAFYPFIRSSSSSLPLFLIVPIVISSTVS